jgi:superfamily II RNA helicase
MKRQRRYSAKSRYFPRKKPGRTPFKPGADTSLKNIFKKIGVPEKKPFTPDPFQQQAISAIQQGDCLVTAPTGTGKTWIAEKAIDAIAARGGKSWYACPLKALSNSKYTEFCNIFGSQNVGILTGDRKENADASIIVGTTEILRNQLYDAMHRGEALAADFVVLDEAHYLGDKDRGVVWEEIIIYLPHRIPLLLLSATIGNADQIAGWLSSIRTRPCKVINETRRPVPLDSLFLHPSGTLLPLTMPTQPAGRHKIYKKVADFLKARKGRGRPMDIAVIDDIMRVLRKYHLLPAIFFLKSRADCDRAVAVCRQTAPEQTVQKKKINEIIYEYAAQRPHILDHRQLWHLKNLAIGSHHSGQLPAWKMVLENLMTAGLLDAVFATSTVSAGVNFPARSVVFFNSDRFNGTQFLPLDATELHQMTGRAGRRGMDNIGFALVVPNRFMDVRRVVKLLNSDASDVRSQIRINFSMVLNLLLSHNPGQIEELLKNSFATYLITKGTVNAPSKGTHKNLWPDFLHHLDFLQQTGFVSAAGELTEDGNWASQLRVDQPLLIAQSFRQALLPQANPSLLAGVIASFVNERESDDRIAGKIVPNQLKRALSTLAKGIRPFAGHMIDEGFEVRPMFMRPAAALFAWTSGQSWEKVLQISELEEGDLAMLILRTADNLRHIRSLHQVFPDAAESAAAALESILREPVVYY